MAPAQEPDASVSVRDPIPGEARDERAAPLVDRVIRRAEIDQGVCWAALGVGMVVSLVLGLWLTRGETFHADDFIYFIDNRGLDPRVLFAPHNGHLIFVVRLIYAVALKIFGPRHYVVFRLVETLGVALVAGLVFAYARRRIGAPVALAAAILLLFLGSAWQDSLDPVGIAHVYSIAAGVGALLALERPLPGADALATARPSWRTDAVACVLLLISVATFSVGLAFLVGAAVSVLLREERHRRVWIFLVPAALYLVWFLAPKAHGPGFSTSTGFTAANVLLIPSFLAEAAAAAAGALAGLSYNFDNPASYTVDSTWGYVVAAVAVAALAVRLLRGRIPLSLWTSLTVLLAFWASTALVTHVTAEPTQDRYVYDAAVLILLVAADALRGIRFTRWVTLAVVAVAALSLMTNVALLRAGGGYLRSPSASDKAELAAVDIARDHVSRRFVPAGEPALSFLGVVLGGVGPYLDSVRYNGSYAYTPAELRSAPEPIRELADQNLVGALRLHLARSAPPPRARPCLTAASGMLNLTVRPPGLLIRSPLAQPIKLRRFATTGGQPIGTLTAGSFSALRIPTDRAPDPWHLIAAAPLTLCSLAR